MKLIAWLVGAVWTAILLQGELYLSPLARGMAICWIVAAIVCWNHRYDGEDRQGRLVPFFIVSNLLLVALVVYGLLPALDGSGIRFALFVVALVILFFLLAVTVKDEAMNRLLETSQLVDERTQQLLYLQEVGLALNTGEEVRSFLDIVLRATANICRCQRVVIFLDSTRGGTLAFEHGYGIDEVEERARELASKGLMQIVFRTRRAIRGPMNDEEDGAFGVHEPLIRGASFLAIPLLRKGESAGVFYGEGKEGGGAFDAKDLEIFKVLGSQIAVALENADLFFRTKESYLNTIEALAGAIEAKDAYTSGHSAAVFNYVIPVARALGIPESEHESLQYAAILHDIGKIAVSEKVLNKPGKLTDEEFASIKQHPSVGAEIIRSVSFLRDAVDAVRFHHERWDGRGYPDGLKGDEIPLKAQIIGVVDTFDAMTSHRSYRKGMPVEKAIAEIERCSGSQFNPKVVDAFLEAFRSGSITLDDERRSWAFTEDSSYRTDPAA